MRAFASEEETPFDSWQKARHRSQKRRRLIGLGSTLAAILALGGWILLINQDGRGTPPVHSRTGAEVSLAAARDHGAEQWAGDELQIAHDRFWKAEHENAQQKGRLPLLRDFRAARESYRQADSLAQTAEDLALERHANAYARAESLLAEAVEMRAHVHTLHTAVRVAGAESRRLRSATNAIREAGEYIAQENYALAEERVESARRDLNVLRAAAFERAGRFVDVEEIGRWERWIAETVAWSRKNKDVAVIVNKEKNLLTVYRNGVASKNYPVDLGSNRAQTKQMAGDLATPEGKYTIKTLKGAGQSQYYKALEINYPNREDLARFEQARKSGRIPRRAHPGSLIEIHGEGGKGADWTKGCVALSNRHMDEVFAMVRLGTPVTIVGGDGSGGIFSELLRNHPREEDQTP